MNRPIPETTINNLANSHEDTLLLLDLMRHKRQQEGQKKRVRIDKVTKSVAVLKNIARVRNCPDIAISNSLMVF